jgi:signal transduction histidine kinase
VLAALACLLPLVGVVFFILVQSLEHNRNQLVDAERTLAVSVSQQLVQTLEENQDVLEGLAAMDSVRSYAAGTSDEAEELQVDGTFSITNQARPHVRGIFLVNAQGEYLIRPALDPETVGDQFADTLDRTLKAGEVGVSGRLSIGDYEVIVITVPIEPAGAVVADAMGEESDGDAATPVGGEEAGGSPVGAVGALLSVERLQRTFPATGGETEIAIASPDQMIVSTAGISEDDSLAARLAEPIAQTLAGVERAYEYDDLEGDERLAVFTPVDFAGAEWAVLVSRPSPAIYGPDRTLLYQGLTALAIAGVVTLCLALVAGEAAARPLRQLTVQAQALAEGNFTQRIEPTGSGEVRSLSIAFREMEERLADQVRDLESARQEREQQAEELRDLNRRTVRLQEEERRRIAADIHDAVSPLITGALYQTRAVRLANGGADPVDRDAGLDAVSDLLERAGVELHGVIFSLRPPDLDDIGVVAAIERYMTSIQRHGLTFRLEVAGEPPAMTPDARLGIYRIVQESLHNVVRHAGADEAVVRIESTPELLRVVVRDNGSGFDPERAQGPTSLGILSMRERAAAIGATVEIASRPGGGTVVVIERPTPDAVMTAASEAVPVVGAEAPAGPDQEIEPAAVELPEIGVAPSVPRRTPRRARNGRAARPPVNGVHHRTADGGANDLPIGEAAADGSDGAAEPPAEPVPAPLPIREGRQR